MKKIYYIEREHISGFGAEDLFGGVFATELDAVKAADEEWRYLTAGERRDIKVCVFYSEVPEEIELDEAMDWIYDEGDGSAYNVAEFSNEANVKLVYQSDAEKSIKAWRLEDGWFLCLIKAEDE